MSAAAALKKPLHKGLAGPILERIRTAARLGEDPYMIAAGEARILALQLGLRCGGDLHGAKIEGVTLEVLKACPGSRVWGKC